LVWLTICQPNAHPGRDDEPAVREALERILRLEGFDV
jgi:hypothetical protein